MNDVSVALDRDKTRTIKIHKEEHFEGMRRAGHPWTSDLLAAIGHDHPSKVVAKAARKTLFQREGRLVH